MFTYTWLTRGVIPLPQVHDVRFVEDNWESPVLGAWGLGWEVWLDGMEVTQFTYFQQVGADVAPGGKQPGYGGYAVRAKREETMSCWEFTWVVGVACLFVGAGQGAAPLSWSGNYAAPALASVTGPTV